MTPRLHRALLITVVVAMAALSQIAIILPIGATSHVVLWIPSAVAVCLFGAVPGTRDGALVVPWAVGVGCLAPGIAALADGNRVLFVGVSGLLLWLTTEVAVLARAELAGAGTAARATGALDARLEALLLVALVALAAMFAAVLVALTDVGGGVMVALLALAAAGAYRTASTRLR